MAALEGTVLLLGSADSCMSPIHSLFVGKTQIRLAGADGGDLLGVFLGVLPLGNVGLQVQLTSSVAIGVCMSLVCLCGMPSSTEL
jgi:hypothetical protein